MAGSVYTYKYFGSAMTTTTATNGRLCNQIIRNLAVSLIAEKHDLYVEYASCGIISSLGINLYCGKNRYNDVKVLTDANYFEVYAGDEITFNLNPNDAYFQSKKITNMLYDYLQDNKIKDGIFSANPFKCRYSCNADLGVHIRLTDVARFNPGVDYYLNTISGISFEGLYIATDDANHSIVKAIMKKYPAAKLVVLDEVRTIQFLSTCKNVVLSHGSFSAVIGYLSFFSDVYYPEYEGGKVWYGDMFSVDGWRKICV